MRKNSALGACLATGALVMGVCAMTVGCDNGSSDSMDASTNSNADAQNTTVGGRDAAVDLASQHLDANTTILDAPATDATVDATTNVDGGGDASDDAGPLACSFGAAQSLATANALDLFGQISYFNNGDPIPAGRYSVKYVDGCMKYGSGQGWTIHAYADGHDAWWLVGDTSSDHVIMPPGTVGYAAGEGAFTNFDDCVAANLALPPTEFDFAGGKLGAWLQDSPYGDNMAGVDGRNPKWTLTKLGSCDH